MTFMEKCYSNVEPDFLFFFRVSIGILACVHFLSIWNDFDLLYTPLSIIPLELHKVYNSYDILTIDNIFNFLKIFFSIEQSILVFKFTYIALCIFIAIGLFSRFFSFLLLLIQISFVKYGSLFLYGVDFFTSISLFYIFLFPSSSYYSVQKLYFPIVYGSNQSLFLCKKLLQIHICTVYFFSGFDKLIGFNWRNGEAIWKAINLPNFNNFILLSDYIEVPYFYITFGWVIIIIELMYPIFINFNKTRKIWLFLTIAMHIGIVVSFNLFFFSAIMIIWNLTAYYFNYDTFTFKN